MPCSLRFGGGIGGNIGSGGVAAAAADAGGGDGGGGDDVAGHGIAAAQLTPYNFEIKKDLMDLVNQMQLIKNY